MENRAPTLQELFSRGNTPPSQQQQFSAPSFPDDPVQSHIDSLFNQLAAPVSDQNAPASQRAPKQTEPYPVSNSAPVTPAAPMMDKPMTSTPPAQSSQASTADRQNALLSLLGGPVSINRPPPTSIPLPTSQGPTPPGPSPALHGDGNNLHNEAQGKSLLEQLMGSNPPSRSNFVESQRGPASGGVPSPPYGPSQKEGDFQQFSPHVPPNEITQRPQGGTPSAAAQQVSVQQTQISSPPKTMFDFESPFDHLSPAGTIKKKSAPIQPPSGASGNNEDSSWYSGVDPKRVSVDNLLEHLTRGLPPVQVPPNYDSYNLGGEFEPSQSRSQPVLPLLASKPPNRNSPRSSPPKQSRTQLQHVSQNQSQSPNQPLPSQQPLLQSQYQSPPQLQRSELTPQQHPVIQSSNSQADSRRDKESSPGPRGPRNRGPINQTKSSNAGKVQSSPSPASQAIVFDVSSLLDEIQAPRDSVKSTAIALVKQEPVFLPGTTIGATHWVAYAMTRGRVRVISRSSGDRTLLQLPSIFSPSTSVIDMAVFGNRLAGVTSDGGFVVWELPEAITDDVPGHLLLCVLPVQGPEALHSVKWHPKDGDTLAVASRDKLYLIDLMKAYTLHQAIPQGDLSMIASIFTVTSPLLAFDFDVQQISIATISEDSTLTTWNIRDRLPYASYRIRGEDQPSSLLFVDNGIIIGRKNGTIIQLLSYTTKQILSTVKFVNGAQEDNDMFGHISYDARIQTLWVANCRRDSMIAFKLNLESPYGGDDGPRSYFEQVVEFSGPKPTIHFVILTGDADPHGDEAHAACIAAKLVPGDLALVAFSVHSGGVDQILIRKEWYDQALVSTVAKFPPFSPPQVLAPPPPPPPPPPPQTQNQQGKGHRPQLSAPYVTPQQALPASVRTPSEQEEHEYSRDEPRAAESKTGKGNKAKNWKDREETREREKEKEKPMKTDTTIINESALGQALSREIRKTEDSLHNKISKLIGKEMDKQHQRFEDARAHEQTEDFNRQEKILKLISTELSKNTTRVVEMAVKSEVQASVLPALENITKSQIRAVLNESVGQGLADLISQTLPHELEKLLLRSDISSHLAHLLSANVAPMIERHVKDAVNKTIPVYSQQSTGLHQDLLRELRTEIHALKSELSAWQNEAFRSHDAAIRDLEHSVRTLSDQVKYLSMGPQLHHLQQPNQQAHNSPGPHIPPAQAPMTQSHLRSQNIPPTSQGSGNYGLGHGGFVPPPPQQQQQQQQQTIVHPTWFSTSIAAPQASHPATLPQPPTQSSAPQQDRSPPIKNEQWDELYLSVLHTQDSIKLRDLLSRTNPELIMPLNGSPLVSQAVVLTLIHRLSAVVGETPPSDDSFKTSLWWLQRSVTLLRPEDKLIIDFIPRVIPNVQHLLATTKQRLTILPGGPQTMETARTISDIQETLRRKMVM